MQLSFWLGLALIVLGVAVFFLGAHRRRMWLLGAGAGALLGTAFFRLDPTMTNDPVGLMVVVGLAILVGFLGLLGTAFTRIILFVIGFVVGGSVAAHILDWFSILGGSLGWLLSAGVGLVAGMFFVRMMPWAFLIFASAIGSFLLVRGATISVLQQMPGTLGGILAVVLTGFGIFYHYQMRGGKGEQANASEAKPAQPEPAAAPPPPAPPAAPPPAPPKS